MLSRVLYFLIQWTWGLPQNLAGLFVYIIKMHDGRVGSYRNARTVTWNTDRSMSLGMFIFLGYGAGERILKHEYGHSLQSVILGPAYLFAVGIPSFLWCNFEPIARKWKSGRVSYYSRYPESWADRLGFARSDEAV